MKTPSELFTRLRAVFTKPALDADFAEELAQHLEAATEDNIRADLSPEEARRQARIALGGIEQTRELHRDARGLPWLENLARDVRFGLRSLRKSPAFTAVAVFSLALGIGANTAVFSVVKAILLRSLPVPNPQELRLLNWSGGDPSLNNFNGNMEMRQGRTTSTAFSYAGFREFQSCASPQVAVFAFFPLYNLTTRTHSQVGISQGLMVSGNYFKDYGGKALVGRVLTADDDREGADPVAVITHRFWDQRFALDPNALGQSIDINRHTFTIVGVLPPDYASPMMGDFPDVYVPMAAQPQFEPYRSRTSFDHWWVLLMARLAPCASDEQLRSVLGTVFRHSLEQTKSHMNQPEVELTDGKRGVVIGRAVVVPALFALQGVAVVVLLVACANLAGLLLARHAARRRELAVCVALGAGRMRLISRSLLECLLLALAGGAAGLVCAQWMKAGLLGFIPDVGFEMHLDTNTDSRVLLFTLVVASATALLFGLLPAWRASRVDPLVDLQSGRTGGWARNRTVRVLVATQIALSLFLAAGAGLFTHSLANLRSVDPGFDRENLLLFDLHSDQAGFTDRQRIDFFDTVRVSVARIPGTTSVALSDGRLVGGTTRTTGFSLPGKERRSGETWESHVLTVGDGYFDAMRIPFVAGREFSPADVSASVPVVIINDRFAREHFPNEDPIGRTINIDHDYRIIGVCGSTLYAEVRTEKPSTMYFATRQSVPSTMTFALRTVLPPLSLVSVSRKAVAAIDPSIPLTGVTTQEALFERSVFFERLVGALCGSLAGLAVLLSCIGLYGLLGYNVTRRTSEIGVRMALGAPPGEVARAIVREALATAVWGVAVGLPLAIGLGLASRKALYSVSPYDPATIATAIVGLLCVAALAAWLPARRAARIDPMMALRAE